MISCVRLLVKRGRSKEKRKLDGAFKVYTFERDSQYSQGIYRGHTVNGVGAMVALLGGQIFG